MKTLKKIIKKDYYSEYFLEKYDEIKNHNNKIMISKKAPKIIYSSNEIIPCSDSIESTKSDKK